MVTTEHQVLQVPLTTVIDSVNNVRSFGKSVTEFAGLKVSRNSFINLLQNYAWNVSFKFQEHLSYVTPQDSGTTTPEGYHDKNSVSVWGRAGRKLLNPTSYFALVEGLKPDIFQMLYDGDTNVNSSIKRVKKSVDTTLKFATVCASLKDESEVFAL